MKSTNHNKITIELLSVLRDRMTFELAQRLEDENYASPFRGSKIFHLLRLLAINRTELSSDFVHFLN